MKDYLMRNVVEKSMERDALIRPLKKQSYCETSLDLLDSGLVTLNEHYLLNLYSALTTPELLRMTITDEDIPVEAHSVGPSQGSWVGRGPFAEILGKVGYEPAVPDIREALLHDRDSEMREYSAQGIGAFGREHLSILKEALKVEMERQGTGLLGEKTPEDKIKKRVVINKILFAMKGQSEESELDALTETSDFLIDMIVNEASYDERTNIFLGPLQRSFWILKDIGSKKSIDYLISIYSKYPYSIRKMAERYLFRTNVLIEDSVEESIGNSFTNRIVDKINDENGIEVYRSLNELEV